MWSVHKIVQISCTLGNMFWCNIGRYVYVTCTCIYYPNVNVLLCIYTVGCVIVARTDKVHHYIMYSMYCYVRGSALYRCTCTCYTVGCVIVARTDRVHRSVGYGMYCYIYNSILYWCTCTLYINTWYYNQSVVEYMVTHTYGCRARDPEFEEYTKTRSDARVAFATF